MLPILQWAAPGARIPDTTAPADAAPRLDEAASPLDFAALLHDDWPPEAAADGGDALPRGGKALPVEAADVGAGNGTADLALVTADPLVALAAAASPTRGQAGSGTEQPAVRAPYGLPGAGVAAAMVSREGAGATTRPQVLPAATATTAAPPAAQPTLPPAIARGATRWLDAAGVPGTRAAAMQDADMPAAVQRSSSHGVAPVPGTPTSARNSGTPTVPPIASGPNSGPNSGTPIIPPIVPGQNSGQNSGTPIIPSIVPVRGAGENGPHPITPGGEAALAVSGDDAESRPLLQSAPSAPASAGTPTAAVPAVSTAAGSAVPAGAAGIATPPGAPGWNEALGDRVLWMAGSRIGNADIQLHPAEMGPLRIRVSVEDGATTVAFQAQHPATREAIEQALPRLRELLNEQGLSLGQATVSDQGARRERPDTGGTPPGAPPLAEAADDRAADLTQPAGVGPGAARTAVDLFA